MLYPPNLLVGRPVFLWSHFQPFADSRRHRVYLCPNSLVRLPVYFYFMKKWFSLGLLLTSLICYLQWGGDNSGFLFNSNLDYFVMPLQGKGSFLHPLIILPMLGQVLFIITLFQKDPSRKLIIAGMVLLGLLVGMILLAGIVGPNFTILVSTLPFFFVSGYFLFRQRCGGTPHCSSGAFRSVGLEL